MKSRQWENTDSLFANKKPSQTDYTPTRELKALHRRDEVALELARDRALREPWDEREWRE